VTAAPGGAFACARAPRDAPRRPARAARRAAAARARRDLDLEMVASIRKAAALVWISGEFDTARTQSRRWLSRARDTGDTLSWCQALLNIGVADLFQQHWRDARRSYSELLRLTRLAHLSAMEGYARIGDSYLALSDGDAVAAERGYRQALRLLPGTDAFALHAARAGLANALYQQIKPDAARREYERVLADSRARGDRRNELAALNDLGAIEFQLGDPGLAANYYREAAEGQRRLGNVLYSRTALRNMGLCLEALGHSEGACAIFDSLALLSHRDRNFDQAANLLGDLARVRRGKGRYAEAESVARRVVAARDSISMDAWTSGVVELGEVLLVRGRAEDVRSLYGEVTATLPPERLATQNEALLLEKLGVCEIAPGDAEAAVAPLRRSSELLRGARGVVGVAAVRVEASLARAFAGLGKRDSALAHFRSVAAAWERGRAAPSNPVWREAMSGGIALLYGRYASLLLDPSSGGTESQRVANAFMVLQPFRSRTLEDALRGAEGRSMLPRVTLYRLQREVLRPGEVLVDVFSAPETTFVFAVTRAGIHVAGAPGRTRLGPRLSRFRDMLAARNAEPALVDASARLLGSDLLGRLSAPIKASRVVLIAAGTLGDLPLGMLRLPGDREPLALSHQVAMIPSATLLAASRAVRGSGPAKGVLALSRATDAEGRRLPGVERETRWLRREIPGAQVRANDADLSIDDMLRGVGGREVLHLAAHSRAPARAPWRAGFLLGRGAGEDAYLTASRISTLHVKARVCVLASCTSAGVGDPEGIPNLAAAWLSAGATAVVATLWPQDDEATTDFVVLFYSRLQQGESAGSALRETQRTLRSRGGAGSVAAAGFVLIGDPTTPAVLAR
jgi:tetratricopeptide (TPR) repeat protein